MKNKKLRIEGPIGWQGFKRVMMQLYLIRFSLKRKILRIAVSRIESGHFDTVT